MDLGVQTHVFQGLTRIGCLQQCQGHEKQEEIEELSQIEGDMTTNCTVASWSGSWNRKKCVSEITGEI